MHYGTIPGAENALLVCDPLLGTSAFAVSGVSDKAVAKAVGRGAEKIGCSISEGKLIISAKRGAQGFFSVVVDDGGREKPFDVLVCEGVRLIRAKAFSVGGGAVFARGGGEMVQDAVVFGKSGGRATVKCATGVGRFAVMPLVRMVAGNVERPFAPRLKVEVGGKSLACGRPINRACCYYKAKYGKTGGRANWKWDYPLRPDCKYYLEQMLIPELSATDSMTVSLEGSFAGKEEVELAAVLMVPDPDEDLHGDLIKTLCGLNTQRSRVR